jgi:hypothetical protein
MGISQQSFGNTTVQMVRSNLRRLFEGVWRVARDYSGWLTCIYRSYPAIIAEYMEEDGSIELLAIESTPVRLLLIEYINRLIIK